MFVKPAEGLVIPDPDRHDMLPADGRDVPLSDFWMRRLHDGDIVEAKGQDEQPPPGSDALKTSPAITEPRTETQPNPDGTATFAGDHPAEPAR